MRNRPRLFVAAFCLMLLPFTAFAASSTWAWAKHAGSNQNYESGTSVGVDAAGNAYVTGFIQANAFGTSGFGSEDVFVAKYSPGGALLWVARSGGASSDWGNAIAVDAAGNSYVTGFFYNSATFRSSPNSSTSMSLVSQADEDVFIAKYDTNGVLQWVTNAGSTTAMEDQGSAIALDQAGGVYLAGIMAPGPVIFFDQPGTNGHSITIGSSPGPWSFFVAKYTTAGAFVWASSSKGAAAAGNGIAVDPAGTRVVVAGNFAGTMKLGSLNNLSTAFGYPDLNGFIATYDGSGTAQWAEMIGGGSSRASAMGVALDGSGNVFTTGSFHGVTQFFAAPATTTSSVSGGPTINSVVANSGTQTWDVFVTKYDASGALQFVNKAAGGGNDYAYAIAFDGQECLITGFYELTTDFNVWQMGTAGSFDAFVARFNPMTGLFDWANRGGGQNADGGKGIAANGSSAWVTGTYMSQLGNFGTVFINATGTEDVFLAKIDFTSIPDLYIRDSLADVGAEPDTQTGSVMWASTDIWVRNAPDTQTQASPPRYANEHNHQNPEYATVAANTPWIYVKCRNRGSVAVSGQVHVYWANASLGLDWDPLGTDWTEIPPVSTTTVTLLSPGDSWVTAIQWTSIPVPSSSTNGHFCLLARFVADASTPDPINGEVINNGIWGNAYNSNNIAWKNVTVVDNFANRPAGGDVFVHNIQIRPAVVRLAFDAADPLRAPVFFEAGTAEVDLGPELFKRWVRGGRQGAKVRAIGKTTLRILDTGAWIGNLALKPRETFRIGMRFRVDRPNRDLLAKGFDFDVSQFENNAVGRERPVGGERYMLRTPAPRIIEPAPVKETP